MEGVAGVNFGVQWGHRDQGSHDFHRNKGVCESTCLLSSNMTGIYRSGPGEISLEGPQDPKERKKMAI
jgi:hypothetical protein